MSSGTRSLIRIFTAIPIVVLASSLAAATVNPAGARACAGRQGPSNFDYLVLASIADSPNLLAMAGYRSTAAKRGDLKPHPAASLN